MALRIILIKVLAYPSIQPNRALEFLLSVRLPPPVSVFGELVWLDTSTKGPKVYFSGESVSKE